MFTTHSSLQKRAMHTKKSVYCDNDSMVHTKKSVYFDNDNMVHTKTFSVGKNTLELVGNYTIISGIAP